jgi:hypothetical protein
MPAPRSTSRSALGPTRRRASPGRTWDDSRADGYTRCPDRGRCRFDI